MSDIERLSGLISQSVQLIVNACSGRGISLPDLNATFDKVADTAFRGILGVTDAVNIIAAAAVSFPLLISCRTLVEAYEGHFFLFTVPMF